MTINELANINSNLHLRRARNQPVQKDVNKLITEDELFFLQSSLFSTFHSVSDSSARVVLELTEKLGNILAERKLKDLALEFRSDLNLK